MENLQRMRVITAHYRSLQGLRMLPWFLWALAFSAVNPILGLPQGYLDYQCLLVVPGLVVPWGLSRLIGNYYDRLFGQVEGLPSRNPAVGWLVGVGVIVIAYIGFFVDSLERLPVSMFGLMMALALLALWWMTGRFLHHYLLVAVLLAALSLLPLAGIPAEGHWHSLLGGFIGPIVFGLVMSIGSVLSHIALVRNLKALSQVGS